MNLKRLGWLPIFVPIWRIVVPKEANNAASAWSVFAETVHLSIRLDGIRRLRPSVLGQSAMVTVEVPQVNTLATAVIVKAVQSFVTL